MPTWLKWTLGIGGGLFALKLINDSQALAAQLKAKASQGAATNFVGGHPLPNPTGGNGGGTIVTSEATLGNSNPNTQYARLDDAFFGK